MNAPAHGPSGIESPSLSFCSMLSDGRLFGIDTLRIREVLSKRRAERVPLAPAYIAGIVPYRGEILTAVSLRALLRADEREQTGSTPPASGFVLVVEDEEALGEGHGHGSERFGLLVDAVCGVVTVERGSIAANPSTLDGIGRALFSGAVRTLEGLLVRLDPHRLNPARLARTGVFTAAAAAGEGRGELQEWKEKVLCVP